MTDLTPDDLAALDAACHPPTRAEFVAALRHALRVVAANGERLPDAEALLAREDAA